MNRKLSIVLQVAVGVFAAILLLFVITSIGLAEPLGTALATIMTIIYAVLFAGCIWLIRLIRRKTRPIVSGELEQRKQKEPKNTTALKESELGKRISGEQDTIAYISDGRTTRRADGKPLTDDDVQYLRETGFDRAKYLQQQSPNPKFHHTSQEEALSERFALTHSQVIDQTENAIYDEMNAGGDIDSRILHLQNALRLLTEFEKVCCRSKGGTIYFEDMWGHCHNSSNQDFSIAEDLRDELEDLTENYEERKKEFEMRAIRKAFLKDGAAEVLKVIQDHPGILQRDVHKMFAPEIKPSVSTVLKKLVQSEAVKRVPQGRTYELFIAAHEIEKS